MCSSDLRGGDEGAQSFAQGAEPLAVIDQLTKCDGQLALFVGSELIQSQSFQHLMSLIEDGTAGRLIDAAALHAHKTVLHYIVQADAVAAADLVELCNDGSGLQLLAVQSHRHTLFKFQLHKLGLVRRGLGADAQLKEAGFVVLRLVARIFQIKTFVAQMPQVLVLGVVGLPADLQRDVMSFGMPARPF